MSIGTYAAVKPLIVDSIHLMTLMCNFKVPHPEKKSKLHSTILHSSKYLPNYLPDVSIQHIAVIIGLEIWSTKNGNKCLVMKFHSPTLVARHNHLMNEHSAQYEEYTPHMSLSYDAGDYDYKSLCKSLPRYITLGYEYTEPLDISDN